MRLWFVLTLRALVWWSELFRSSSQCILWRFRHGQSIVEFYQIIFNVLSYLSFFLMATDHIAVFFPFSRRKWTCVFSVMKKTGTSDGLHLVTIGKDSTANSNRECSMLPRAGFSSHCHSLKLKLCTAEKMPWKYNPLHSRKINKQGHPNFQLVLVQNAGNGKRSVQGALGWIADMEQWQTGRLERGTQAQCEDGRSPRKTAY